MPGPDLPDARAALCLTRLWPHLRPYAVALTGGLALHLHFQAVGRPSPRQVLADLDLVAADPEAVSPSVTTAFLVNHYHLPQPGYAKFLIQLVDPVTRLRVDVFPHGADALSGLSSFELDGLRVPVLAPETMLAHKRQVIGKASIDSPVDGKHLRDAIALAELLDQPTPTVAAACLAADRYSTDLNAGCARCDVSRRASFPLAAKAEVFAILGYV